MADVLHKTIGATFPYRKDYRTSENEIDYDPAEWIIDPNLSDVDGFDDIYWNISVVDNTVSLANQGTRNARDQEIADFIATELRQYEKNQMNQRAILRAIVQVLVDEINILRAQHSLPNRTLAQARTAIEAAIDGDI